MRRALFVLALLAILPGATAAQPTADSGESAVVSSPSTVEDAGASFVEANRAYEEAVYDRAIELYARLVEDADPPRFELYYNLGNAYLRHGELGRAIASYRRAERLAPRDQGVQENLEFARRSRRDAVASPTPSKVWSTLLFWHYRLSPAELLRSLVVANLLWWAVLAMRLFRRGLEALRWAAVLLGVVLLALGGSLAWRTLRPARIAVVVPEEVVARAGLDADSAPRFELHAGTETEVVERRDGWVRVALPDGPQGWIEEGQVVVVAR